MVGSRNQQEQLRKIRINSRCGGDKTALRFLEPQVVPLFARACHVGTVLSCCRVTYANTRESARPLDTFIHMLCAFILLIT
jgi:hypothetical protein